MAVVAGLVLGSAVNMGLIMISGLIIPPPNGVDVADMESLQASMHLFEPRHFVFPFLAHALGTLAGSFLATRLYSAKGIVPGLIIGFFFLTGGIANAFLLPAPGWFVILDLVFAYLPTGWIGYSLAKR
ncbi:MAG: hypothetical protein HOH43_24910 [Candidatus Latescibacteria bacterium]|nr:hypothetical protein [Candidatus Latescibacterota bacterium]